MEELMLMERAKSYLEMLSNGIDPITGEEVPNDSVINNIKLRRCFAYVSDILQQVIDNKGKIVSVVEKQPFYFSAEQKSRVKLSEEPISILSLAFRINAHIDAKSVNKLSTTSMHKWLVESGLMIEEKRKVVVEQNKTFRSLTKRGSEAGFVTNKKINSSTGEVSEEIKLTKAAQMFVLENLEKIAILPD